MGAQGVSLGTRFVATDEAFVSDEYKRRVVASGADDTFYSEFLFDVSWPDVPHRAIKTRAYDEWVSAGMPPSRQRPGEGEPIGALHRPWGELEISRWTSFMATPWFDGDLEYAPLWAGEADEVLARVGR